MISISLQNITKRFGTTVALDDVSLKIESGEIFFLLGPSGCGKTTLLRHIAGFYTPDKGRILFGDDDVTNVPPHKRNTGMMFQSYALWPHMTVAKNVAFGLEERRVPRDETTQRVTEALRSVRMEAYAERKINQLSGGQQQRVALARALVVRPRCLLLDEPLSNLDAKLRLEMRTEIRRVCKEFGLTAIYVTHDQKEALSISDRMAIMDSGRIGQIGNALEIYRSPRNRLVADFIGEANFIEGTITASSNGDLRIDTALGPFRGRTSDPAWNPGAGEKVQVCVRPESWRLETSAGSDNSIKGRVGESIYLGEVAQYTFHSENGEANRTLKINEMNPRAVHSGERQLYAVASPEDVCVLPV
jgi:iron(III) transport system ATP-binding protein